MKLVRCIYVFWLLIPGSGYAESNQAAVVQLRQSGTCVGREVDLSSLSVQQVSDLSQISADGCNVDRGGYLGQENGDRSYQELQTESAQRVSRFNNNLINLAFLLAEKGEYKIRDSDETLWWTEGELEALAENQTQMTITPSDYFQVEYLYNQLELPDGLNPGDESFFQDRSMQGIVAYLTLIKSHQQNVQAAKPGADFTKTAVEERSAILHENIAAE
jgi:hypothetical protein